MFKYLNIKTKKRWVSKKSYLIGFTLIETLVTIAIFTIIMGAVFSFIIGLYDIEAYTWRQARAIREARIGVETMIKQIREARVGDDGSFAIKRAGDKEFIFFSDIDGDGRTERVRYFLGTVNLGTKIKECQTLSAGGSCSVIFSDFLQGDLTSAEVRISVQGDFSRNDEYVRIYAAGINYLGKLCEVGCHDCPGIWEGAQTFDVTDFSRDDSISLLVDASAAVNRHSWWGDCPNHAMRVKLEFSWTEKLPGKDGLLKKGVIHPVGHPAQYSLDQEIITILSSYVRNVPPIFRYFDGDGNRLIETPARLKDTRLMKIFLVVNVNPEKIEENFELKSAVQLRNLKK